jgi:hypothetical protein
MAGIMNVAWRLMAHRTTNDLDCQDNEPRAILCLIDELSMETRTDQRSELDAICSLANAKMMFQK